LILKLFPIGVGLHCGRKRSLHPTGHSATAYSTAFGAGVLSSGRSCFACLSEPLSQDIAFALKLGPAGVNR